MNKNKSMNRFLYSLLVNNKMDNFTVTEIRDALIQDHSEFTDPTEARKFIYRQLTRSIEKGLIKREDSFDGKGKKVIYSKTEKYFESNYEPIVRNFKNRKKSL